MNCLTYSSADERKHDSFVERKSLAAFHLYSLFVQTFHCIPSEIHTTEQQTAVRFIYLFIYFLAHTTIENAFNIRIKKSIYLSMMQKGDEKFKATQTHGPSSYVPS